MLSSNALEYLRQVEFTHKVSRQESNITLKLHKGDLNTISRCLEALYQISTCATGCKGGDHLHEYLAGRCYNLGCAAFSLIRLGYYDESLNHVRSLGEIANLQSLFWVDHEEERKWRTSDLKTRLNEFGPAKVRKKLEARKALVLMDADTYSRLCEQATHVTPDTKPNFHTNDGHPRVGPHQQATGAKHAIDHLTNMLVCTSLGFAKFTFNDILFSELERLLHNNIESEGEGEEAIIETEQ